MPLRFVLQGGQVLERGRSSLYSCFQTCIFVRGSGKSSNYGQVISGEWRDPYTGQMFTNPSLLDVDHVVPLKEAFHSGAKAWSRQKKILFANDLENKDHLIAVYRSANRSKGARDPARWLPSNQAYHREYVRIGRGIKKAWGLSMVSEEERYLQRILHE